MIALVSTSRSLLALDLETGMAKEIHTGRGLYFGISYCEDLLFLAARNNFNCFEYLDDMDYVSGSVIFLNYELQPIGEMTMPTYTTATTLRDLHQLVFFDEELWIVCARDNLITIFDSREHRYWFPSPDKKERWKDVHHFNSIWLDYEEENLYLLAHQRGPSEFWKFSYPDLELNDKVELGNEAHNIWEVDGALYTCDSKNGTVISTDGFKLDVGDFTRGAVITDDIKIIGTSDIAKKDLRHRSSGAIHIYDSNWKKLKQINITGYGQVNDIRLPGVYDLCHHWEIGKRITIDKNNLIEFKMEEM